MQYIPKNLNQYSVSLKTFLICTGIFFIIFSALIISSKTANAGLLSFMSSLIGGEQASAKIDRGQSSSMNNSSQNLAILQAATNRDPNPHKSSDIAPVSNNTLMADLAYAVSDSGYDEPVNTQISLYTVRPGDTLSDIALMFDVSVNTIMWANDITRATAIRPGDTLIILPVSGLKYTVKKGDTIAGIVSKYKADLSETLRYNDLTLKSPLSVGQIILIPDAEIQISIPTKMVVDTNKAHDTNGPNYSGYYIRPVKGGVKTQGLHGYNAIDIGAPIGTPIYASAPGVVILSRSGGYNGGYGNYVIISHPNGTQTVYAHNTKNLVLAGEQVERGQQIATMGSTGKSTGSHLHFEIRGAKNPF